MQPHTHQEKKYINKDTYTLGFAPSFPHIPSSRIQIDQFKPHRSYIPSPNPHWTLSLHAYLVPFLFCITQSITDPLVFIAHISFSLKVCDFVLRRWAVRGLGLQFRAVSGGRSKTSRRSRAITVKKTSMQCSRNVPWIPTRPLRSFSFRVFDLDLINISVLVVIRVWTLCFLIWGSFVLFWFWFFYPPFFL